MAKAQPKDKEYHPNAEVDVYDHQMKQSKTMLYKAYENLKNETMGDKGRRIMRYTLGKSKVPAPTKKGAEE